MTSRRPAKRLKPRAAPKGMPMMVLKRRAVPETCSERATISNSAWSMVMIRRNASARPCRISSMVLPPIRSSPWRSLPPRRDVEERKLLDLPQEYSMKNGVSERRRRGRRALHSGHRKGVSRRRPVDGTQSRIPFPMLGGTAVSSHTLPAPPHRPPSTLRRGSSEMLRFDYSKICEKCNTVSGICQITTQMLERAANI